MGTAQDYKSEMSRPRDLRGGGGRRQVMGMTQEVNRAEQRWRIERHLFEVDVLGEEWSGLGNPAASACNSELFGWDVPKLVGIGRWGQIVPKL